MRLAQPIASRKADAAWNETAPDERPWRIGLYSPGMVGLGHLRRNLLIAQTIANSSVQATTLLIAEARQAGNFAIPAGVDTLILPALRKDADGQYEPRYLDVSTRKLVAMRAKAIRGALAAFAPDVLLVDHLPLGAIGELKATLVELRRRGRTRVILGLRDVLEAPETVRHEWSRAGNERAIQTYYDQIWVYGDQTVCDHAREYSYTPAVANMLRYTGYLDQRSRIDPTAADPLDGLGLPPGRLALCLVGGGQDGAHLAEAFAAALPPDTNGVIVTGPFMPQEVQERLQAAQAANERLRVLQFVAEPTTLVQQADLIVAMGGYNTVAEVLSFQKRALIVPRVPPRYEQLIRAERLRDLGLIDMLRPEQVTPDALRAWLARPVGPPARVSELIDLNGLTRLPHLLTEALAVPPAARQRPNSRATAQRGGRWAQAVL